MTMIYLDDGTGQLDDEASLSALTLRRLRDNLEAVHLHRPVKVGWQAVVGYPWRMLGLRPTAYGPILIRHQEQATEVAIEIYYHAVRQNSVWVTATCGGADPADIDPPPSDLDEWFFQSSDATPGTISLTARTEGRRGTMAVWIWVQSRQDPTDDDSGDVVGGPGPSPFGVVLDSTPAGLATPIEHALYLADAWNAKGAATDPGTGMLYAFHDTVTGEAMMMPAPEGQRVSGIHATSDQVWVTRELGVMDVDGLYVAVTPSALVSPTSGQCAPGQPAAARVPAAIATRIRDLVSTRQPAWLTLAGPLWVTGLYARPWRCFPSGVLTTSWVTAASAYVASLSSDHVGFVARLCGLGLRQYTAQRAQLELRLSVCSTPGGAVTTSGTEVAWDMDTPDYRMQTRRPLIDTFRAIFGGNAAVLEDWAGRGMLWSYGDDPTEDIRSLSWSPECELRTTPSLPCEVRIEIRLATSSQNDSHVALIGGGIFSLGLDE